MKSNYTVYMLTGLSLLLIAVAIYFHNGYIDLINGYIYNDTAIPSAFSEDKLYFMNKKLSLKNRTIYGLCFFSILLLYYNRGTKNISLKRLLFVQCIVVILALLFWIIRPKGLMIY